MHTNLAAVAVMAVLAVAGTVYAVVVSLADRSRARRIERDLGDQGPHDDAT